MLGCTGPKLSGESRACGDLCPDTSTRSIMENEIKRQRELQGRETDKEERERDREREREREKEREMTRWSEQWHSPG